MNRDQLKFRTFCTTDDLLTLQTCCDASGVPLTVGGDPTGVTGRINGFERPHEPGLKGGRLDWSVVYLHPKRSHELVRLRAFFRRSAGIEA